MTTTVEPPKGEIRSDTVAETTFAVLPLCAEVRKALDDMGYHRPTPVQLAVFDPAVRGKDLVVQARTGTGKTAAFGLPIIDRGVLRTSERVQALVLCPTRELALQVSGELSQLGKHRSVQIVAIYGGAPMQRQIDAIAHGAHIVAGTPGRVLDHLRRGTLDPKSIRTLVLDEADEMLSMGFERELTAILERLPKDRQTLLFSATVPPDIERMARTRLKEPEFVILSSDHVGALEVLHFVYWVSKDKLRALESIIEQENPESAIVFCNTREATEHLAQALMRKGYDADWLNGDLPQSDREKVMRRTREGRLRFLVATDVAARGIDISHLTHVINYDFPQDAEGYVHRTGRTGRAGRTGTALSLVTPREIGALYILRLTYKIRPIERQLPTESDRQTRLEADIVASLVETFRTRGRAPEIRALARRLLCHDEAEAVIAGILHAHLSSNPEVPELAESRRRSRLPEPVDAALAPMPASPPRAPSSLGSRRRQVTAVSAATPDADAPHDASEPKGPTPFDGSGPKGPALFDGSGPKGPARREVDQAESGDEREQGEMAAPREGLIEVHIDVGRRNGARVRTIKSLLADAGVPPEHVHRIRVRERYCFVEIAREHVDAALDALNASTLDERPIHAALSQRSIMSSAQGDKPSDEAASSESEDQ